ncbi:MAG: TetR/AcrR family transcriptional regulator [Paenisporosarcina sp.]|nr:TetR/AcrR family transcriptional regulator [Paenisporosarcina sp.]
MKKVDLRVKKTKLAIEVALLKLLETMPFQDITINNIAEEAMINRATFYSHYTDKYDLLDRLVEEKLSAFRTNIYEAKHVRDGTLYPEQFLHVICAAFQIVEHDLYFFKVLLANQTTNNIKDRFMSMASEIFTSQFDVFFGKNESNRAMPKELFLPFIVSGVTGTIFWWIEQDQPYTPEQMANYLLNLVINGPAKTMGLHISN